MWLLAWPGSAGASVDALHGHSDEHGEEEVAYKVMTQMLCMVPV